MKVVASSHTRLVKVDEGVVIGSRDIVHNSVSLFVPTVALHAGSGAQLGGCRLCNKNPTQQECNHHQFRRFSTNQLKMR